MRARPGLTRNRERTCFHCRIPGVGAVLFAISVVGIFLNRKNVIVLLMAIELMLLAVNTNFLAFSPIWATFPEQVFVFFILTVAASESRDRPGDPGGSVPQPEHDQCR